MKRYIPTALIALFLLAALACGTSPTPSNPMGNSAQVRVVQGASDTGSVDVFVNGAKQPPPPMTPMMTPPYFKTNPGSVHFEMVPAGNSGPALIDTSFPVGANTFATVVTVGRLSNNSLATMALIDDHSAPPAGKLKLRMLHGSSTLGAVDVYISKVGQAPASPPTFANLTFDAATSYLSVPRENFETCIMPAGSQPGTIGPFGGSQCLLDFIFQVSATGQNLTFAFFDPAIINSGNPGQFTLPLQWVVLNDLN